MTLVANVAIVHVAIVWAHLIAQFVWFLVGDIFSLSACSAAKTARKYRQLVFIHARVRMGSQGPRFNRKSLRKAPMFVRRIPRNTYVYLSARHVPEYKQIRMVRVLASTSGFHFMIALLPRLTVNRTTSAPCHKVGIPLYDCCRARATENYHAIQSQS